MSSTVFDQISSAADHLAINHRRGKYHKPVALVWAIDRAVRRLPRLATAATVRSHLDSLLEQLTGIESNAAWPWLKLANDLGSAWRVDGADPSEDPQVDFVAGWSRSAYLAIEGNPDLAGQLIESTLDRYLDDVRWTVVETLGLTEESGGTLDTVIVAAGIAYDEYLTYSAYICQPDRSFRSIERFGFYRDKHIEPLLPEVLHRQDHVTIDEPTFRRLEASANANEQAVGALVERLLADGSPRIGETQQIFLLSEPGDDRTLDLGTPVAHKGAGAWTQSQRYAASALLRKARSTGDL
jgi:hypothetical protein